MNEKDNRIFNSRIMVSSENELWATKKNSGSGSKVINTLFPKFFQAGYDNIVQHNINAKISKKITESMRSRRGV